MKIKVNRNYFWAKIFFEQLVSIGVQYTCVCPGSRSTPLATAISANKKIKSYVFIDERSSSFFALGLAKATEKPVMIVTTSGTAVAELYPAIIEAYQQRVPLIICTADRPPELIGTGANQTINQHNIFKNHIRWFRDLGLPSLSKVGFQHLQKIAIKSYQISLTEDRGPIHLNFPFRKPLEPNSITDEVSSNIVKIKPQRYLKNKIINRGNTSHIIKAAERISDELVEKKKGVIIVGPMEYNLDTIKKIKMLSALLRFPVFADGLSQHRFGILKKEKTILSNFNSFLKSEKFAEQHDPEIIIQFGRTPTSSVLDNFLQATKAERYVVNSFGDNFDPSRNAKATLAMEPKDFCDYLITRLKTLKINKHKSDWINDFNKAEEICESLKLKFLKRAKFPNEPSIITETLNCVPSGRNIFIGNSLPVRDLDNFTGISSKKISVQFNRGASGIDGVSSTALGIAVKKKGTVLVTGDLSFLHDLNALNSAVKFSIPITIIVINNNGGGIFETLPIARKLKQFEKFFVVPHNLELSKIVKSFGIDYQLITSKSKLQLNLTRCLNKNSTSVLEIQTDSMKSAELRNKYFNEVNKKLDKEFSL